jgi:hypothetical protein
MIIESEREAPVEDDQPFHMGLLAELDEVPVEFSAFHAMHQEIRNKDKHNCLQEDLVEYLWTRRGNAQ